MIKNDTAAQGTALFQISSSVILSSIAQILLKLGMLNIQSSPTFNLGTAWDAGLWILPGFICYGLSMLLWMAALTKHELSFAYPLLSMSYILVYLFAANIPELHETVSGWKTAGILCIVIGVILVGTSKNTQTQ